MRPHPSDSVSHLIFLSRLYVSMAGREEQPVSGFSRQVDALSALFLVRPAQWYVVHRGPQEDRAVGHLGREDYPCSVGAGPGGRGGDPYAPVFLPGGLLLLRPGPGGGSLVPVLAGHRDKVWRRPGLLPALGGPFLGGVFGAHRVDEPLFLYVPGPSLGQVGHRWDRLVGEAFRHYAARALSASSPSPAVWGCLYDLSTEGNACPMDESLAAKAWERLAKGS